MRARQPDLCGSLTRDGVEIHYEVHGDSGPTILLLPPWTIVHSRVWKMQVPYLARHFRVVTYDGPGNGESDRPTEPGPYEQGNQTGCALDVLDATGTDRAVVVGMSKSAHWALDLAANHRERVLAAVFIGAMLPPLIVDELARQILAPSAGSVLGDDSLPAPRDVLVQLFVEQFDGPLPDVDASMVPAGGNDPLLHWVKYNASYWLEQHEDFLWHFFGACLPEPHSTKAIEDCVRWGLDTVPEVLIADFDALRFGPGMPDEETLRAWCARVRCPVLAIHGDHDWVPLVCSERLTEATGGELFVVHGGGHLPQARDPVQVNLAIREFVERHCSSHRTSARRTWSRGRHRAKRVLYLSSPIGLGHAQRDLAVARELRERHPDVEINWLTQHPVTAVLEQSGEYVHPASRWLANESAHIEDEADEHDLHCFQALRNMDEILLTNFMVFQDLVRDEHFDLVVGDESWDLDHFLHENPELKRYAYAWFTDFVGYLPMPDADERERFLTADYNAEMIGHIERFPYLRDQAIFVGNPEDIVPETFGPDLPAIRDWTTEHYEFAGYVTGFDPTPLADREELREELGYAPDEDVCIVTVGGSGVGGDLLRRVIKAFPEAKARVPGLRMVVVAGPRIDPTSLPAHEGLEVRAYVHQLYRHLAACDLAVVQGGLTTCMELTATGRPFVYIPLRHHFEQNLHVHHRLRRYGAGHRLDYDDATPEHLAETIAAEIGREVTYRPVETDGAARAADLLSALL
jgi:pimeloyl-ACP methyl ester carboxylesterase/predicted glycosyltransferase